MKKWRLSLRCSTKKMDSLLIRWLCCLIKMANYMHKEVRMM